MWEDLINQQWQALAQLIRGSKLFGPLFAPKPPRHKPWLTVAIGKRRKVNALEEYRRRFTPAGSQAGEPPAPLTGFREPPERARESLKPQPAREPFKPLQPAREPLKPQAPIEKPVRPRLQNAPRRRKRVRTAWSSHFSHYSGEARSLLLPALLRGYHRVSQHRNELIAAVAACVLVFGGAYVYRSMEADGGIQPSRIGQLSQSVDSRPKKPAAPASPKLYNDRLPAAEGPETAPGQEDEVPPVIARTAETPIAGGPISIREQAGNAPASPEPASAGPEKLAGSGPIVVRSEHYLPDGTRIDPGQPAAASKAAISGIGEGRRPDLAAAEPSPQLAGAVIEPSADTPAVASKAVVSGVGEARRRELAAAEPSPPLAAAAIQPSADTPAPASKAVVSGIGEARRPELPAAEPSPPLAAAAIQPSADAPAAAPQPPAPAAAEPGAEEPVPALAGGFFAQVRSDQDLKAAEAELAEVAEKYKSVLGEMPLTTRQADLKDRGIWFRVLIGPVKSHDEADNLCRKLKSAGLQACIVQKID